METNSHVLLDPLPQTGGSGNNPVRGEHEDISDHGKRENISDYTATASP
jgi:hypothetical protein